MFDIGWSELLLIAIVAIIVIGPKELPGVLRNFGRMMNKMRRTADDFRRQFEESVSEGGFDDIRREIGSMRQLNPADQIRDSIDDVMRQADKPVTPPAAQIAAEPPAIAEPVPASGGAAQAEPFEAAKRPASAANGAEPDHGARTVN